MDSPDNRNQSEPENFEAAVARLERIIEQMETGSLALEDTLVHYREGLQLLQHCEKTLANAEAQIATLEATARPPLPPKAHP